MSAVARPMLFSNHMVLALLREAERPGTGKTQTRRQVKFKGKMAQHEDVEQAQAMFDLGVLKCPYGQVGDLLYVRETHVRWGGSGTNMSVIYMADGAWIDWGKDPVWHGTCELDNLFGPKNPAIHLPRWASRLTLRLTEVRIERLNSISEADAIAEGRSLVPDDPAGYFPDTWEAINGKGAWALNPWVWALTFTVAKANVDTVLGVAT